MTVSEPREPSVRVDPPAEVLQLEEVARAKATDLDILLEVGNWPTKTECQDGEQRVPAAALLSTSGRSTD